MHKSGPKRGQRMATNQRHQANALRKSNKRKNASGGRSGGAAIGGGAGGGG